MQALDRYATRDLPLKKGRGGNLCDPYDLQAQWNDHVVHADHDSIPTGRFSDWDLHAQAIGPGVDSASSPNPRIKRCPCPKTSRSISSATDYATRQDTRKSSTGIKRWNSRFHVHFTPTSDFLAQHGCTLLPADLSEQRPLRRGDSDCSGPKGRLKTTSPADNRIQSRSSGPLRLPDILRKSPTCSQEPANKVQSRLIVGPQLDYSGTYYQREDETSVFIHDA